MTISERIRKAALGPMPKEFSYLLPDDYEAWIAAYHMLYTYSGRDDGVWGSNKSPIVRAMSLLFVAEALK